MRVLYKTPEGGLAVEEFKRANIVQNENDLCVMLVFSKFGSDDIVLGAPLKLEPAPFKPYPAFGQKETAMSLMQQLCETGTMDLTNEDIFAVRSINWTLWPQVRLEWEVV